MTSETPHTSPTPPPHEVAFDWRDWLPHLAEADIPDADKQAMIEALWSIVVAFVALGFAVKSTADLCGESIDLKAALEAAMVSSDNARGDAA